MVESCVGVGLAQSIPSLLRLTSPQPAAPKSSSLGEAVDKAAIAARLFSLAALGSMIFPLVTTSMASEYVLCIERRGENIHNKGVYIDILPL